jgi:hypothetical protein
VIKRASAAMRQAKFDIVSVLPIVSWQSATVPRDRLLIAELGGAAPYLLCRLIQ